jgi:hypothetical protein
MSIISVAGILARIGARRKRDVWYPGARRTARANAAAGPSGVRTYDEVVRRGGGLVIVWT